MKKLVKASIALASIAIALGASTAQASTTLPPMHQFGQTGEYVTGGIGQGEAKAMQTNSKAWPLTLEFVVKTSGRAEFASDVNVIVKDTKGRPEFNTVTDGPFLLAKLPPGKYLVDATLSGTTLHRNIVVKSKATTKMVFEWPPGTGA